MFLSLQDENCSACFDIDVPVNVTFIYLLIHFVWFYSFGFKLP